MTEVQTTLLSHERLLSKKQKPFWKFTAANGKEVLAFRADLAAEAMKLQGRPAILEITEKPSTNPDYPEPSYFLDSVAPDHSVAVPNGDVPATAENPVESFNKVYDPIQDPKQAMIVRQSAFKAACFLLAGVYNGTGEFSAAYQHLRALTDELVRLGMTGQWDVAQPPPENVTVPWDEPGAAA